MKPRGRPVVLRNCPTCGEPKGARELIAHMFTCGRNMNENTRRTISTLIVKPTHKNG